ncbi:MAG: hypothetical protein DMD94_03815 [Candidatus Rokuibacteriota bacterium]|nr:MAG: hypothetical protein DMD94_03815 [Candidatus Rokubacteria bacterium]
MQERRGGGAAASAYSTVCTGPFVRIEPGETRARVVIAQNGQHARVTADHVVCTIPFSVLRRTDVSPSFSPHKSRAVRELSYSSSTRAHLQFRRKAWPAERPYVTAATDLPIKWVFGHTVNQPGPADSRGPRGGRRGPAPGRGVGARPNPLCAFALGADLSRSQ